MTDILELLKEVLGDNVEVVDLSEIGALTKTLRRQEEYLSVYRRQLAEKTGCALDEILLWAGKNHCDHGDHRIIPRSSADMRAVHNFMEMLASTQIDSFNRCLEQSFDMGAASAKGEPPQGNATMEALNGVLNAAVLAGHNLLADGCTDAIRWRAEWEFETRKRVMRRRESLLRSAGSMPPPQDDDKGEKHGRCH